MFVASDQGDGSVDKILKGDPVPGGILQTFVGGLNDPSGLTVDVFGDVWVAEEGTGAVRHFDPNGVDVDTFYLSDGLTPADLAMDVFGSLWILGNDPEGILQSHVLQYDLLGNLLLDVTLDGVTDGRSIAINPFDGNIFVSAVDRIIGLSVEGELTVLMDDPSLGIDDGGGIVFTLYETPGQFMIPEPATIGLLALGGLGLISANARPDGLRLISKSWSRPKTIGGFCVGLIIGSQLRTTWKRGQ